MRAQAVARRKGPDSLCQRFRVRLLLCRRPGCGCAPPGLSWCHSVLQDKDLPSCDGLFLGGGFPETHMDALHDNATMRAAVARFVEDDGPVYAECGGLMYLCDSLTWGGKTRKMAGVIPTDVDMHAKPQGRGYVRLRETADHLWPLSSGWPRTGVGARVPLLCAATRYLVGCALLTASNAVLGWMASMTGSCTAICWPVMRTCGIPGRTPGQIAS